MNDIDTLYARYISGELSKTEIQSLKASGEWEELEKIIHAMDKMSLPAYNLEEGYQKLRDSKGPVEKKTKTRKIGRRGIMMVAASMAILFGVLTVFRSSPTSISAEFAAVRSHTFKDQSKVALNSGSSINYRSKNWDSKRKLELEGEALFHVEKGAPFIVETKNGQVEVLGTSFNVRSWGSNLYVECYSGKVKVSDSNDQTVLTKGQAVNIVNGKMQEETLINHEKPLWSTGSSKFYEEDLTSVFEEVQRQFNVEVNSSIPNRRFSGSFRHDNLNEALELICKPMGLTFSINDNGNIVTIQ